MHDLEPFYNWQHLYNASVDKRSPFYGKQHSEIYFEHTIYNYYIHPQWDDFGSQTLYLKLLFVDYDQQYCIIEFLGEWNDILYNDVMYLYRNVIESLLEEQIKYFILIGENVLDFHADTDDYYAEWFDNIEDGWIIGINFRKHVIKEFTDTNIDQFIAFGGGFDSFTWRKFQPEQLFSFLNSLIIKRLT
ncbi:MAG: hypothetical protein IH595_11220 [Bacteroidales bacterium]|nr:hypothetical protein [Bacteroidales bacterium]